MPKQVLKSENPVITILSKAYKYLIIVGAICYLLGFVIENIYLGSLHAANFDVLRVRYILIGFMFCFFLTVIFLPLFDYFKYVRTAPRSFSNMLFHIFRNAFYLLLSLMLINTVYRILAGPYSSLPLGIPFASSIESIDKWFSEAFGIVLINSLIFYGKLFLFITLLVDVIAFFAYLFFPKVTGERLTFGQRMKFLFTLIKQKILRAHIFVIIAIGLFALLGVLNSFIVFLGTNKIVTDISFPSLFTNAETVFLRFALGSVSIYLIINLFLLASIIPREINPKIFPTNNNNDLMKNVSAWIYAAVFLISILIPAYSFGIYPLLPQQVGGGSLVPIDLFMNNAKTEKFLSVQNCSLYLLDKTSTSSLVFCSNQIDINEYFIIEIPNSEILSTIYLSK